MIEFLVLLAFVALVGLAAADAKPEGDINIPPSVVAGIGVLALATGGIVLLGCQDSGTSKCDAVIAQVDASGHARVSGALTLTEPFEDYVFNLKDSKLLTPTSGRAIIELNRPVTKALLSDLKPSLVDLSVNRTSRLPVFVQAYVRRNHPYVVPIYSEVQLPYATVDNETGLNVTLFRTVNAFIRNETRDNIYSEWVNVADLDPGEKVLSIGIYSENLNPSHQYDWQLAFVRNGQKVKEFKHWFIYNSSYAYYKQLTVTNNNNTLAMTTNFTVNVTLDTAALIAAGKMQSDCKDLSIVNNDSGVFTELDRNVSGCNTTATTFVSRLFSTIAASSSSSNYLLFYGNNDTGIVPPNDADRIWQLQDTFPGSSLNASKWTCASGTCTVANNMLYLTGNGQQDQLRSVIKFNNRTAMQAFINQTDDGSTVNMLYQGFSNSNADSDGDVVWCSVPGVGCTATNPTQVFADRQGSVNYNTANVQGIQAGFTIRKIVRNQTAVAYITNSSTAAVFGDAKANASFLNVMYGERNAGAGYGHYLKEFKAYEYIHPDPSYAFGAETSNSIGPTVVLNAPANAGSQTNSTVVFNVTPTQTTFALANITIYGNWSGTWSANSSNTSVLTSGSPTTISVAGIPESTFVWNAYACDVTGNCTFATSNFTYTVTVPVPAALVYVSPTPSNSSYSNATYIFYNVTFSDASPDSCTLTFNGTNYSMTRSGTNCYVNRTSLSDGQYFANFTVNNTAGKSNVSATLTASVDTAAPTISAIVPINSSSYDNAVALTINVSASDSLSGLNTSSSNDSIWPGPYSASGNSFNLTNSTVISQDYHTVLVRVNDSAGNTAYASTHFSTRNLTFYVVYGPAGTARLNVSCNYFGGDYGKLKQPTNQTNSQGIFNLTNGPSSVTLSVSLNESISDYQILMNTSNNGTLTNVTSSANATLLSTWSATNATQAFLWVNCTNASATIYRQTAPLKFRFWSS